MKLLICIKQVMESTSGIQINNSGQWIKDSDDTRFAINPYDEYVIEEAVHIKEKRENVHIDALTVGPSSASDILRRAMGMGADEAIHILDETRAFRPPAVTASWIAHVAKKRKYDLILTGIMSDDEMNGQTGPMIAQILDLPCTTAVIRTEIQSDNGKIMIEREIQGGAKDIYRVDMPCVLTIQTGINSPRYPSLSKVMRARKRDIELILPDTIKPYGRHPNLHALGLPEKKPRGIFLEGSPLEKADKLASLLTEKSFL